MRISWLTILFFAVVIIFTGCEIFTELEKELIMPPIDVPVDKPIDDIIPKVINWEKFDDFEGYVNNNQVHTAWAALQDFVYPDIDLEKVIVKEGLHSLKWSFNTRNTVYGDFLINEMNIEKFSDYSILSFWICGVSSNEAGNSLFIEIKDSSEQKLVDGTISGFNFDSSEWVKFELDLTEYDLTGASRFIIGINGDVETGTIYLDDFVLKFDDPTDNTIDDPSDNIAPVVIDLANGEGFEDYTDNNQIYTAWAAEQNFVYPDLELETVTVKEGAQSLKWNFNTGNTDYGDFLISDINIGSLSEYSTLSFWIKGDTSNEVGNSIWIEIKDSSEQKLVNKTISGFNFDSSEWVKIELDLTEYDLTRASRFIVGIYGYVETGTIYLDDIILESPVENVTPVVIDWAVGEDFEDYTSTDQILLNYLNCYGEPVLSLGTETGISNSKALELTYKTDDYIWGNYTGVKLNNDEELINWSTKVLRFWYKGSLDNTLDNIKIELWGAGDTPNVASKFASFTTSTKVTQTEEWTEMIVDFVVDLNYQEGDASTMNTAQWLVIGIKPGDSESYEGTILIDNITFSDSQTIPPFAGVFTSDDFESYIDTDDLKTVWSPVWNGKDVALSVDGGVSSSSALEILYDTSIGWTDSYNDGNWEWVNYGNFYGTTFDQNQDLTNKTINISVLGASINTGERLALQIMDIYGERFLFETTNTVTDVDSWTTFSVNLSSSDNTDGTTMTDNNFNPALVEKILLIVKVENADDGDHLGSIFIDNIEIVTNI